MIPEEVFHKYIKRGFSVFPVLLTEENGKIQKKPVVEWREFQNRFPIEEEVCLWCDNFEFNAIGLATGKISGVTVLDIDDPEIDDYSSSVEVRTISGGKHLWYRYKPGVRNTVRINGKPVDVRGDGGFVVIPPSKLNDKQKYDWIKYDFEKMEDFPLIVKEAPVFKQAITELPEASEGSRNQTAISVAGHMIANTQRKAWDTTAWPAFLNWNQTMVNPPLDESELRITFDSACQMETVNKPRDEQRVFVHFGSSLRNEYDRMVSKWGDGLTTGYHILDDYFKFLPEQMYLISSPTHQGKTTLSLNMAARVASYGHHVLFCSLEQGMFIVPRIESMLGGPVPPTFGMLSSDVNLSSSILVDSVKELPNRPELIVIDHLHFMKKDLKQGITGGIDKMIIDLQNTAKTMQIPIVVISHLRKLNEDRSPTLDDLRDSSSLSQVPSVVIQLHRETLKETGELNSTGSVYVRKNRISGKLGRLRFDLLNSGSINISKYRAKDFSIDGL